MPSVPEVPDSILQTAALRCPERPWKMELRIAVLASGSQPKQSVHWTMARANSDTLLSRQGLQAPVMPRIADYHPIRGSAYSSGNGRQAAEHSQNTAFLGGKTSCSRGVPQSSVSHQHLSLKRLASQSLTQIQSLQINTQ